MKPEHHSSLLKTILTWMITRPDYLQIVAVPTGSGLNLGVQCHVDDYRFIIGKSGRAIQSLQMIFGVIGRAEGKTIKISVSDPGGVRSEDTVIPPMSWDRDIELGELLKQILAQCTFVKARVEPQSAGNQTILTVHPGRFIPEELQEAIDVIFRAMGRMNGRFVELDVR